MPRFKWFRGCPFQKPYYCNNYYKELSVGKFSLFLGKGKDFGQFVKY